MAPTTQMMPIYYEAPTCSLEVWGALSPLSPLTDKPVIKRLRFRLQVRDRNGQPNFELRGMRPQLLILSQTIQTYVQHQLSYDTPPLVAASNQPVQLVPTSLVQHQLQLGSNFKQSPRGPFLLGALQLADISAVLEQLDQSIYLVPADSLLAQRRSGYRNWAWGGAAAAVLLTVVGVGTVISRSGLQMETAVQSDAPAELDQQIVTRDQPDGSAEAPLQPGAQPSPETFSLEPPPPQTTSAGGPTPAPSGQQPLPDSQDGSSGTSAAVPRRSNRENGPADTASVEKTLPPSVSPNPRTDQADQPSVASQPQEPATAQAERPSTASLPPTDTGADTESPSRQGRSPDSDTEAPGRSPATSATPTPPTASSETLANAPPPASARTDAATEDVRPNTSVTDNSSAETGADPMAEDENTAAAAGISTLEQWFAATQQRLTAQWQPLAGQTQSLRYQITISATGQLLAVQPLDDVSRSQLSQIDWLTPGQGITVPPPQQTAQQLQLTLSPEGTVEVLPTAPSP